MTRVAKNAELLLRDLSQPKWVTPGNFKRRFQKNPLYMKMILWSCGHVFMCFTLWGRTLRVGMPGTFKILERP